MDKKELINKLKIFKRKIEKKYNIDKMILFGSRAEGRIHKNSDVDLILIGKFKGKTNLQRAPPLYIEWNLDLPVDFLCYTPTEFRKLSKMISIVNESLKKGIIIE